MEGMEAWANISFEPHGAALAGMGRRQPAPRPRRPRRQLVHAAAAVVQETLWTTRCAICDAPGALLCADCALALPFIDANRACPRCGAPFGAVQCTECNRTLLAQAGREGLPLDGMGSALALDDAARRLVTTYKDRGERRLAGAIGALIARVVPPRWLQPSTVVTFVPATAAARARRGFDHAELLAQAVADQLGIACLPLLDRPHSADQRLLGRRGRLRNLQQGMACRPGARVPRAAIVVDDVCTTGATLYGAADALRAAGTQQVYGATLARVWD